MRTHLRSRALGAACFALALVAAACGGAGEDTGTTPAPTPAATEEAAGGPREGPTITVGSFNFPESVILAEIYAQALEADGYPIDKKLDLGSRELIFPSLESGEIDFLPEYLGSALAVGFEVDAPTSPGEARELLTDSFAEVGVTVLEPAPGEDKNVFVVTKPFADEHGVAIISDLNNVEGDVTLGGPPECEQRATCYQGLQDVYGLDNLRFSPIAEGSARIAALENDQIQVALLFSTQPVIEERGLVVLEEDKELIPPENVVPVVRTDIVEAYGDEFVDLVDSISEQITTEVLLDLNGQVELEAEDPSEVARTWLEENGFLDG